METPLPHWAKTLLNPAALAENWRDGIYGESQASADLATQWFEAKGGSNFNDRMRIPFTMSSLDSPVYRDTLKEFCPTDPDAVIVDVGAADGRNTLPLLNWGQRRVVPVEPIYQSLRRLCEHVQGLGVTENVFPIQADCRSIPLRDGIARLVIAIEVLYYLNEEHSRGLAECSRLLEPGGRLILAERSWEGALLTGLMYGGVSEMLQVGVEHYLREGPPDNQIRSRSFTEAELVRAVNAAGLKIVDCRGISLLSVVLGYLRGQGKITENETQRFSEVAELMRQLGRQSQVRRVHLIIAEKP
jgi:SAM-dependent methyltransferase